jgi:hypothetical protein
MALWFCNVETIRTVKCIFMFAAEIRLQTGGMTRHDVAMRPIALQLDRFELQLLRPH